jgi:4-oxalocrotonate tautomerase
MPVAKIHVHEGAFDDNELSAIGLAVQAALEEVLSVPPEDYFRITHVLPSSMSYLIVSTRLLILVAHR